MATQLQIRRGTSAQIAAFTGAEGEIVVNTTNDSVHVNDGSTAGGFEMARADLNNVSDTSLNAALTGNTVSALTVTALTAGGAETDAFNSSGTTLEIKTGARVRGAGGGDFQVSSGAANDSSEPTYTFRGDPDTGIFWGGANTVGVTTGGNQRINIASNGDISFYEDTGTTAKLFWDASAESLGIGTSSPSRELEVTGSGNVYIKVTAPTASDSSGIELANTGGTWLIQNDDTSSEALTFDLDGSEAMRIDQNGHLRYGQSSEDAPGASNTVAGVAIRGGSDNRTFLSVNASYALHLNRNTSNGVIQHFAKDGNVVGSIGTSSPALFIGSGDVGIRFDGANDRIRPVGNASSLEALRDGAIDLGDSGARFKDLYLSGEAKVTSTGVDGAYAPILRGVYSGNSNETNTIETTVSSSAADSGFKFNVSNGGGSSGQTEGLRITRDGLYAPLGIKLGGTGAANKLDDYEEGTWTVGFSGATVTPTNSTAFYTKVGRLVFYSYYSQSSTIASAGGAAEITGLPFTVKNSVDAYQPFYTAHNTFFGGSTSAGVEGYPGEGQTFLRFVNRGTAANATFVNGSSKYIMVAGFYITDS